MDLRVKRKLGLKELVVSRWSLDVINTKDYGPRTKGKVY